MAQSNSKAKDKRPARTNYWNRRHLERNKVCAMMKAYGLDETKAKERWNAERKGRVSDRFVQDFTKGKASTHTEASRIKRRIDKYGMTESQAISYVKKHSCTVRVIRHSC